MQAQTTSRGQIIDQGPLGIDFSLIGGERPSSLAINKAILSAAVSGNGGNALSRAIEAERDWRKRYPNHLLGVTERSLESPESALSVARNGLESTYAHLSMTRGGESLPVSQSMASFDAPRFATGVVHGSGSRPRELAVPYRGRTLTGDDLRQQLERWVDADAIEPSARDALIEVLDHPEWLDLSDLHIALLGAGAEVGPLEPLLRFGANVWAVDVKRTDVWRRIVSAAQRGSGILRFPTATSPTAKTTVDELCDMAGADLLLEAPEVRSWLLECKEPLIVGGYAYLDGKQFVRLSLAMDAIMNDLVAQRPDTTLAYLLTPTDAYGVPMDAAERAAERFARGPVTKLLSKMLRAVTIGRACLPNLRRTVTGNTGEWGLIDNLLVQQGPNYALAKRLQRWRSIVARDEGVRVSCNVAPATATSSVTQNRLFRAGYAGSEYFGVEIFAPETTNTLMTGLLIYDVRSQASLANPMVTVGNPEELFMQGASHGGFWRMAYQLRSVLQLSVLLGLLPSRKK